MAIYWLFKLAIVALVLIKKYVSSKVVWQLKKVANDVGMDYTSYMVDETIHQLKISITST